MKWRVVGIQGLGVTTNCLFNAELRFKGSLQSLGKWEDFILAPTSSQGVVKLKKITCSSYEALFATGQKNCYGLKMDI